MDSTHRAILLPVDGTPVQAVTMPGPDLLGSSDQLDWMKSHVGGWVEAVMLTRVGSRFPDTDRVLIGARVVVWINEEGKLLDLPMNVPASQVAAASIHPDGIFGPAFLTATDTDGYTVGLSPALIETLAGTYLPGLTPQD